MSKPQEPRQSVLLGLLFGKRTRDYIAGLEGTSVVLSVPLRTINSSRRPHSSKRPALSNLFPPGTVPALMCGHPSCPCQEHLTWMVQLHPIAGAAA
jgi:hypothetical protein